MRWDVLWSAELSAMLAKVEIEPVADGWMDGCGGGVCWLWLARCRCCRFFMLVLDTLVRCGLLSVLVELGGEL